MPYQIKIMKYKGNLKINLIKAKKVSGVKFILDKFYF